MYKQSFTFALLLLALILCACSKNEAVWPNRGYFNYSAAGRIEVLPDSFTKFRPVKGGRDRFLTVDAQQALRLRELFSAMVSEAPSR